MINGRSGLYANYAPRMRAIATITGIFLALATPVTYLLMDWDEQARLAQDRGLVVAERLKETVRLNPLLWKYSVVKFMQVFEESDYDAMAAIRIYDNTDNLLESQEFNRKHYLIRTGRADISYNNRRYGRVEVDIIADRSAYNFLRLLMVFSMLAAVLSFVMYRFPAFTIKGAEADIDANLRNLRIEAAEREANEKLLAQSLREKEILLREIHHRVKNNLQIITSLINLKIGSAGSAESDGLLRNIKQKILTMAIVHEQLYEGSSLSAIGMENYIRTLVNAYRYAYDETGPAIRYEVAALDALLSIEAALPIGLIICEIITNSQKYAFIGRGEGAIRVVLESAGENRLRLTMSDDGIGLPVAEIGHRPNELGLLLVESLAAQLKAKVAIVSEGGVTVTIDGIPY